MPGKKACLKFAFSSTVKTAYV